VQYNAGRLHITAKGTAWRMVFASPVFLFVFLPLTLLGYFTVRGKLRNVFLLLASLFFYAWGETAYVLIMIASICVNYFFGILVEQGMQKQAGLGAGGRLALAGGVTVNLLLLGYFKYANFLVGNLNIGLARLSLPQIALGPVHLPIGISFFTFHAISYLVDIYRRQCTAQRTFVQCALYIALFPQLIAGPILRYRDMAAQLVSRTVTAADFSAGVQRFVFGLAKKVILANPLGQVADKVFALPTGDLTAGPAWLGVICYGLQIYLDFSAYSDMAIGLGRMFGFRILENFNYPYISLSIREFWRRWHISLSTWFRDYLYIPLGGSRGATWRTYLNLTTVFLLCGLWHGASWSFVIWGLLHGVYLVVERVGLGKVLARRWRPLQHGYSLLLITISWVFFRAADLSQALGYLSAMFGGGAAGSPYETLIYLNNTIVLTLLAGIAAATPVGQVIGRRIEAWMFADGRAVVRGAVSTAYVCLLCALFLLSIAYLAAGTYNPFIYFRF